MTQQITFRQSYISKHSSSQSTQRNDQLIVFFSSFLSDTLLSLSKIKNYIYQIVNIKMPQTNRDNKVAQDIVSILGSAKIAFNDLNRIQSLLKGYTSNKIQSQIYSKDEQLTTLGDQSLIPQKKNIQKAFFKNRYSKSTPEPSELQQTEILFRENQTLKEKIRVLQKTLQQLENQAKKSQNLIRVPQSPQQKKWLIKVQNRNTQCLQLVQDLIKQMSPKRPQIYNLKKCFKNAK